MEDQDIRARVHRVAEQMLAQQQYVRPIDVLLGLGWLAPSHVDRWRQGRVPYLEPEVQAGAGKVSTAMLELRRWARASGLTRSETAYVARTRDRRRLRFSASGDPKVERVPDALGLAGAVRPQAGAPRRATEPTTRPGGDRRKQAVDLHQVRSRVRCRRGPHDGGRRRAMPGLRRPRSPRVPAGRRCGAHPPGQEAERSAVVVRWSRSRKRYERQGILAEPGAIERAEAERSDRSRGGRGTTRDEAHVRGLTGTPRSRSASARPPAATS